MFKFILFLTVMVFGLSTKVLAQGKAKPPLVWSEDDIDNSDDFYKKTRTDCIRTGIQKALGEEPDPKYIAAIALLVRNDSTVGFRDVLINSNSKDYDAEYRLPFLHSIARHISSFGVCTMDDKTKGLETTEIEEMVKKDKQDLVLIGEFLNSPTSTLIKYKGRKDEQVFDNDAISKLTAGVPYGILESIFPTGTNDKAYTFRLRPDKERKELVEKGTDFLKNHHTVRDTALRKCLPRLEHFQRTGNFTSEKGIVSAKALCDSMINACGYPWAKLACTDNPRIEKATAPPQIKKGNYFESDRQSPSATTGNN